MPEGSTYRLSAAHLLRIVGVAVLVVGLGWVLAVVLSAGAPVVVVLAALSALLLLAATAAFLRPPRVLTLDAHGYRVHRIRGAGEQAAPWRKVKDVATGQVGADAVLLFRLTDGGTTTVPLSLLGARHLEAQRDVHERLNLAHGYRPFEQA